MRLIKFYIMLTWSVVILKLTVFPIEEKFNIISKIPQIDKMVHLFLFGVLTFLLIIFFTDILSKKLARSNFIFIPSLVISSSYSGLIEYYQQFVPSRYPSWADFLAGFLGGVLVIFLIKKYKLDSLFTKKQKPKLLLHICCIGCGIYITKLLQEKYQLILYFYNPNIYPFEEYQKRLEEIKKHAKKFGLKVIIGDCNYSAWLEKVRNYEEEPEGGKRCEICYNERLKSTVKLAKDKKIKYFATTLSISPHKDSKIINNIGIKLAEEYQKVFLDQDWKKEDGFKKSCELSRELKLYRQNYCGCEFSIR